MCFVLNNTIFSYSKSFYFLIYSKNKYFVCMIKTATTALTGVEIVAPDLLQLQLSLWQRQVCIWVRAAIEVMFSHRSPDGIANLVSFCGHCNKIVVLPKK
jgi:hypothetical protein